MLALISCAKTMASVSKIDCPAGTVPLFENRASEIAFHMSQFPVDELGQLLRVNTKLAIENYKRFQVFHADDAPSLPALLAYTGIVFKRLNPSGFTERDMLYAQEHLRITSFCYGLLRPLDRIKNYRLEGDVRLPELGDKTLFDFWKPILTDLFIKEVKKHGGVLVYLASNEMKSLFDWKKVESEVKVVTPEFHLEKAGKLKTVVVYTKMARGEMTRFLLKERLTDVERLKEFSWEGFAFRPELSDPANYIFTNSERCAESNFLARKCGFDTRSSI